MDTRRVHRVGSSSLAVTLPSEWARQVGLKVGDTVSFVDEDRTSIVLVRSPGGTSSTRKALVPVTTDTKDSALARLLIGCYVVGFDEVEIKPSSPLTPVQLGALRSTVSRLTGFAIVRDLPESFVVRSYLDSTWGKTHENLRQLLGIIEAMVGKVGAAIGRRDLAAAREIMALGDQSDRLYYLTIRFLLTAAADRTAAIRMGTRSPLEIVGGRTIAKALEEVGDSIGALADVVIRTENLDWKLEKDITAQLEAFSGQICGHLRTAVDAFFTGSIEGAERVLSEVSQMENDKVHFVNQVLGLARTPAAAAVASVSAMTLRDICRFVRVIAEVAMNNALRVGANATAAYSGPMNDESAVAATPPSLVAKTKSSRTIPPVRNGHR